jgi:hypothetical protein
MSLSGWAGVCVGFIIGSTHGLSTDLQYTVYSVSCRLSIVCLLSRPKQILGLSSKFCTFFGSYQECVDDGEG